MIVHQFEACYEDVQELLRARSVETGVAEGLNALQLLGDAAFPCLRVSHRDCKVAVYHFIRHHAVYVRNASPGTKNFRGSYRVDSWRLAMRPRQVLQSKCSRSSIARQAP